MIHYVVDASVVIQHFIPDTFTFNADSLFDEISKTLEIHVPEFCLLECTNVLWKQVRFNNLTVADAKASIQDLLLLPIYVEPAPLLLQRALEIGVEHQLAVYDSTYIALAERLGYPLVTVDARQETAARAVGIALKPVTDFQ
ncbi:MAG: type II toxin-antitoxin system VapC family toxin [Chloroflexi bacterium]|nr:type II toxin-antitoxin system VapC family toxin [Chloroflexota bacterium]MCC6894955.1 type II toxin-antitoxin system VapC family toxin [Anaerolineae bacterium]